MKRNAARSVLTLSGLVPAAKIALEVGGSYYLGASSSPAPIVVTSLSADRIGYSERGGPEVMIQRWIGEDLIATGCSTTRRAIRAFLATPFGRKVDALGEHQAEADRLAKILG